MYLTNQRVFYMGIKIGLVDDHAVTRKGIKSLLESNQDYNVIVEASSGKELLSYLKNNIIPDVLILDLSMPNMNGFDVIKEIKKDYSTIKIFIFSFYQSDDVILNAIHLGACGYLPKSADPANLDTAVQSIVEFGFYLPDQFKRKYGQIAASKSKAGFKGKQSFTEKEIQFIRLASSNMTYKEIASKLNVQPKTLENYRDNIFQKLGINNRAALTFYAIENGIVQLF